MCFLTSNFIIFCRIRKTNFYLTTVPTYNFINYTFQLYRVVKQRELLKESYRSQTSAPNEGCTGTAQLRSLLHIPNPVPFLFYCPLPSLLFIHDLQPLGVQGYHRGHVLQCFTEETIMALSLKT